MKNIIRLEELAMFGVCAYALYLFHVDWWWYPLLLFGPDISMLGYMAGNKTGAAVYNLFHHKGVAVGLFVIGLLLPDIWMQITGIILFGHSSMDRFFGYGLKTNEGFKFTHLGIIGKQ
jgi:hypothetical protein